MEFYDVTDEGIKTKVKNRNKEHIRSNEHIDFEGPYEKHLIYFQNGHIIGLHFDINVTEGGHFVIEKVHSNLGISVGDIIVMFNGYDLRGKDYKTFEKYVDQCKNFTLCKALFLKPPFPPELLDLRRKVNTAAHCLKINQNVAFEFLNFGIFHQFLSY